jgi:hypothetical protein
LAYRLRNLTGAAAVLQSLVTAHSSFMKGESSRASTPLVLDLGFASKTDVIEAHERRQSSHLDGKITTDDTNSRQT